MQTEKLNDFYLGQDTPASLDELLGFLGDIAQRHTHGFRDDDCWEKGILVEDKREERIQKIRLGSLTALCRYISQVTVELMKKVGIEGREVEFISGQNLKADTRHVVCELVYDNRYIHADVDLGVMFTQEGNYLSSLQVLEGMAAQKIGEKNLHKLISNKMFDFRASDNIKKVLRRDDVLLQWYGNLSSAMMIEKDIYIRDVMRKEAIVKDIVDSKRDSASFLGYGEFVRRYYPEL